MFTTGALRFPSVLIFCSPLPIIVIVNNGEFAAPAPLNAPPEENGTRWRKARPRQALLELAALYRAGATMQDIGNELGLSRERIRQLLADVGVYAESRPRAVPLVMQLRKNHVQERLHSRSWSIQRAHRREWITAAIRAAAVRLGRVPVAEEIAVELGCHHRGLFECMRRAFEAGTHREGSRLAYEAAGFRGPCPGEAGHRNRLDRGARAVVTGDVAPCVSPDEARDAAAAVAAHIPQHSTLTFKRCGHTRPALSGPSRTVNELCRECLKKSGTFMKPDAIPFINFRPTRRAFPGAGAE